MSCVNVAHDEIDVVADVDFMDVLDAFFVTFVEKRVVATESTFVGYLHTKLLLLLLLLSFVGYLHTMLLLLLPFVGYLHTILLSREEKVNKQDFLQVF